MNVIARNLFKNCRCRYYSKNSNPFAKTWKTLSDEIPPLFKSDSQSEKILEHTDVVIIGGGILGSAIAYSLKSRTGQGLNVVVLDKDLTFQKNVKNWSFSGLTNHFTLPENVFLSKYTADFLRNIKEKLGEHVDIGYSAHGNLVLATEEYAEQLQHNVTIQTELGLKNELLTAQNIKDRYPWINVNGIKLGSIGLESEGWFNAYSLFRALNDKAKELGAKFQIGEVVGFDLEKQRDVLMEGVKPGTFQRLSKVKYKTQNGEVHELKFALCVLAGGADSADIARFARIGVDSDLLLSIPLPVTSKKNIVHCIELSENEQPSLNTPLISDSSGIWVRRNGFDNTFICGDSKLSDEGIDDTNMDKIFSESIQENLSTRIPAFKKLLMKDSRIESMDFNLYDDCGFLGPHPYHNNLYLATGFGNQGIQHAPGIARALTELIIDSRYVTIDMTRFGFDRIITADTLIDYNKYFKS